MRRILKNKFRVENVVSHQYWIIASRYAVTHSILFYKIVVHFASRYFVLGSGLALTRRTTQNLAHSQ